MAAFDGYKVKDRSAKVARRRTVMVVNGKSVFVIQRVIGRKGAEAAARVAARAAKAAR